MMAGLVAACTTAPPDAMPDDAMRVLKTKATVPSPDQAMATRSGTPLDQLGRGYTVFLRKCSECHEPRVPVNPHDPSWHPIVVGMAWNAGLGLDEQEAVEAYMKAAARSR